MATDMEVAIILKKKGYFLEDETFRHSSCETGVS
jgi:hypothetical protein